MLLGTSHYDGLPVPVLLTKIFSLRQPSLRLLQKNILVHKTALPNFTPQGRFSFTNRVECF